MTKFTFKNMEPLEKVVTKMPNSNDRNDNITELHSTATPLLMNISLNFKNSVEFFESLRFYRVFKDPIPSPNKQ